MNSITVAIIGVACSPILGGNASWVPRPLVALRSNPVEGGAQDAQINTDGSQPGVATSLGVDWDPYAELERTDLGDHANENGAGDPLVPVNTPVQNWSANYAPAGEVGGIFPGAEVAHWDRAVYETPPDSGVAVEVPDLAEVEAERARKIADVVMNVVIVCLVLYFIASFAFNVVQLRRANSYAKLADELQGQLDDIQKGKARPGLPPDDPFAVLVKKLRDAKAGMVTSAALLANEAHILSDEEALDLAKRASLADMKRPAARGTPAPSNTPSQGAPFVGQQAPAGYFSPHGAGAQYMSQGLYPQLHPYPQDFQNLPSAPTLSQIYTPSGSSGSPPP